MNDIKSWDTDLGTINFATPEDAKRCEMLLTRAQDFARPEAVTKWTALKDEQPRSSIRYLVTDGELCRVAWYHNPPNCQPWWDCHGTQIVVTHWMDLPSLPQHSPTTEKP